jgi:hypothetical protein
VQSTSSRAVSWRRLGTGAAGALLGVFVGLVALEHALVPQLSPATHMVSEYANSRDGALMVVAFLAWAAALGLTAGVVGAGAAGSEHPLARRSVVALLAVAAAGILVTACFNTQTSAGALPPGVRLGTAGRLHDAGSGLAMVALASAAFVSAWAIEDPVAFRIGVLVFLALGAAGDLALLFGGAGVAGIRQRLLLVLACGWQAALLASRDGGRAAGAAGRASPEASGPSRKYGRLSPPMTGAGRHPGSPT